MKQKRKSSIRVKIIGMTVVPLVILAAFVTVYAAISLNQGMQEEALDGLRDMCYSVEAGYSALDTGDYTMSGEHLMKGAHDVTAEEAVLDNFCDESSTDVTLFYGNTRRATTLKDVETGNRILGTTASEEVFNTVVTNGQEYSANHLVINKQDYYAYYIPMKNADGTVVGMIFAGKPSTEIDKMITTKIMVILGIAVGLLIAAIVFVFFMGTKISKAILKTESSLEKLAGGDLAVSVEQNVLKRGDEIGAMAKALQVLTGELQKIIGNVKRSSEELLGAGENLSDLASHTEVTANEISRAVEDVSHGAVSQAEDIEHATVIVGEMGTNIEEIVKKVEVLHSTSERMQDAELEASNIITELSESSERTFEAVNLIGKQVNLTDESVTQIQEAVTLISSIAEETNLLSLNASIEAARAGEAGKGFAVVASEIQKLAEESNKSASLIADVIKNLSKESKNTVDAMNQMHEIIKVQQQRLQETKNKFEEVSSGIQTSRSEIEEIRSDSEVCDNARIKVIDIIQNLSAVSEENAAATQETTASMQELNSTIDMVAQRSGDLKKMAKSLDEDINFFQI